MPFELSAAAKTAAWERFGADRYIYISDFDQWAHLLLCVFVSPGTDPPASRQGQSHISLCLIFGSIVAKKMMVGSILV